MKVCPECAEDVKVAAQVCRFCGHRFDGAAVSDAEDQGSEDLAFWGYILAVLIPIAGLVIGIVLLSRGRSNAGSQITGISAFVLIWLSAVIIYST